MSSCELNTLTSLQPAGQCVLQGGPTCGAIGGQRGGQWEINVNIRCFSVVLCRIYTSEKFDSFNCVMIYLHIGHR